MSKRPTSLKFHGAKDAEGRPLEYFAYAPARDLDEEDIANLTDEQIKELTSAPAGRTPLYRDPSASASEKKSSGSRSASAPKKASAAKAKTTPAVELINDVSDTTTPVSEPVADAVVIEGQG